MKSTNIRLKQETLDQLKRFAEMDDCDVGFLMRKAIEDMVETRNWQIEESRKVFELIKTGKMETYTQSEMCQWLNDEGVL